MEIVEVLFQVLILFHFLAALDTANTFSLLHSFALQRRICCKVNEAWAIGPLTGTCSAQGPSSSSHVFTGSRNLVKFTKYSHCSQSRPLSLFVLISTSSHFSLHLGTLLRAAELQACLVRISSHQCSGTGAAGAPEILNWPTLPTSHPSL